MKGKRQGGKKEEGRGRDGGRKRGRKEKGGREWDERAHERASLALLLHGDFEDEAGRAALAPSSPGAPQHL